MSIRHCTIQTSKGATPPQDVHGFDALVRTSLSLLRLSPGGVQAVSAAAQPQRRRKGKVGRKGAAADLRRAGFASGLPPCLNKPACSSSPVKLQSPLCSLSGCGAARAKSAALLHLEGFGVVPRTWALSHHISMICTSGLVHSALHALRTNECCSHNEYMRPMQRATHPSNAVRHFAARLDLAACFLFLLSLFKYTHLL